jgi:hypothetical protein
MTRIIGLVFMMFAVLGVLALDSKRFFGGAKKALKKVKG